MSYFQVSAKTGENVEESIISTIKKIVSLYKERPPLRYHLNFERKKTKNRMVVGRYFFAFDHCFLQILFLK